MSLGRISELRRRYLLNSIYDFSGKINSMVRRLTSDLSEELRDVDISEFDLGEGPAGLKAEWTTDSGVEEAVEAVNSDDLFPSFDLEEVRTGEATQVGLHEGEDYAEYSFNSSQYHVRVREYETDWKHSEVEFLGLNGESYREEIAFYRERI